MQSLAENTSSCDGWECTEEKQSWVTSGSSLHSSARHRTTPEAHSWVESQTSGEKTPVCWVGMNSIAACFSMLPFLPFCKPPSPFHSLFAAQMFAHSYIAYKRCRPGWSCSCLFGSWNASKSSAVLLYHLSRTMYLFKLYLWSLQNHHIPYSNHYSSQTENSKKQKT